MIPQAWMVILLISIGEVVNPPQPSTIPSNSTNGRVCCELLCSGGLHYEPLPFDYRMIIGWLSQCACAISACFNTDSRNFLPVNFYFSSTEPISYGHTQQRYASRDKGFLSYPTSATVTVVAKGAYFGENGEEFWDAEVRKESFCIFSVEK